MFSLRYVKTKFRNLFIKFLSVSGTVVRELGNGTWIYTYMPAKRSMAEKKLKESEEKFRTIFENAKDGIALVDPETKRIYEGNITMCKMLGYSPKELKELSFLDIHPEDALPDILETFKMGMKNSFEIAHNIPVKRKDSTVFFADISGSTIMIHNKLYVMGIFRDVTERRKMEKEIAESKNRYETITNLTSDYLFHVSIASDGKPCIDWITEGFTKFTGYTIEEVRYQESWKRIIPRDDFGAVMEFYNEIVKDKQQETMKELRLITRQKKTIWVRVYVKAEKDKQGNITGILGAASDISKQKNFEEKLIESNNRFISLVESSEEGIFSYDKDFRYTYWNSAMERISGFKSEDIIGKNVFHCFPFFDEIGEADSFRQAVKGKATTRSAMPYHIPDTGKQGYFESSHFPLFNIKGEIIGGMAIVREVTEKVLIEKEIHCKNQMIQLIHDITISANEGTTVDDTLRICLQKICNYTGWPVGHVLIPKIKPDGTVLLRSAHLWHMENQVQFARFKTTSETIEYKQGEGLPGTAYESRQPVCIPDISVDKKVLIHDHAGKGKKYEDTGLRGSFAFPILEGTKVVAVLEFFSRKKEKPEDLLVNVIANLAIQLGRVTERKRAEEGYRKLSLSVEQSPVSIVITDLKGDIEYVNQKFLSVTGYSKEDIIGQNCRILKTNQTTPDEYQYLWEVITSGKTWKGEFLNKKKNGELYWERATISPVKNEKDMTTHFLGIKEDISKEKEFENRLVYLSSHDPLTNLFNRRQFNKELEHWIAFSQRYQANCALILIDIDNFKYINDSLGHIVGDEVLMHIAHLLKEHVRETDILARLSGDEFAIILTNITDKENAIQFSYNILNFIGNNPVILNDHQLSLSISIGIVLFPLQGNNFKDLLVYADVAMYKAKEEGRNRFCFFSPLLKKELESRIYWKNRIRSAIDAEQFIIYLQPIFDLKSNTICGYEALLRMQDEEKGDILPGKFLKTAENFGFMHKIDYLVIGQTIQLIKDYQLDRQGMFISINLSAKAYIDRNLLKMIKDKILLLNVDPEQIIFEITETSLLENIFAAQDFMEHLRDIGVRFAIDDFGSGFSNFTYLRHLPIEYLKIDGNFINNLSESTVDQHLVKAMTEMASALNKKTIAEFVENKETITLLQEFGVHYAQGFFLGKPLNALDILQNIKLIE